MLYLQHINNQVGVNKGWKAFLFWLKKMIGGWEFDQSVLIAKLIGEGDDAFAKSWNGFTRVGFLKLAFNANQCRRKPVERVYFFLVCLLMVLVGKG